MTESQRGAAFSDPARELLLLDVERVGVRHLKDGQEDCIEAVEPGREWQVGTITIRGNTVVKTSDITDAMLTKARPWYMSWQFWKKRPAFDPVAFKDDVERVARVYRNTGYYHASATADVVLPKEGDVVDLTVDVDEGPPTYVRQLDVELKGATLPDAERWEQRQYGRNILLFLEPV